MGGGTDRMNKTYPKSNKTDFGNWREKEEEEKKTRDIFMCIFVSGDGSMQTKVKFKIMQGKLISQILLPP